MNVLVLRSYGDYIILLNSIKHSTISERIKIITSNHLETLHEAIGYNFSNNFEFIFIDFRIKKGIFRYFTNKFFLSFNTILEVVKLNLFIKKLNIKGEYFYVEHNTRKYLLSFILAKRLSHIYTKGSIYDSFGKFFKVNYAKTKFTLPDSNTISKVLIFPDSRKKNKVIDTKTMQVITSDLTNLNVNFNVANFGHIINLDSSATNQVVYKDFKELILLIKNCDFIISSDSLPVHIAEFFEMPHLILYNRKINQNWLTPFATKYKMYSTFEDAPNLINSYFKRSC